MVFEVLGRAYDVLRRRPVLFLPAALNFAIGTLFSAMLVVAAYQLAFAFSLADLALVLAGGAVLTAASLWISGMYPIAVQAQLKKQRFALSGTFRKAQPRLLALLWTNIMGFVLFIVALLPALVLFVVFRAIGIGAVGMAVGILMLIAFLAALVLAVAVGFSLTPVVMLEKVSGMKAIRRSFEIGKAHFWNVLGITLVITVPSAIVSFFLGPGKMTVPAMTPGFVVFAVVTIALSALSHAAAAVFCLTVAKKKRR